MQLCELLPRHARVADRFTLLRSVVHTGFCHQQGTHQILTGFPERILRQKPLYPDVFSVTHRLRYDRSRSLPNYVGVSPINYSGSAYLGNAYDPFPVTGDPNADSFSVPNIGVIGPVAATRLQQRISLRQQLDHLKARADYLGEMDTLDEFEQQALNVLTGTAATRAFDIATRERYGRNRWGQQLLLARRLVESGVDLVTGEFGRTPKISYQKSTGERIGSAPAGTTQPGRDHWPRATSILFAGGGMSTGQVVGQTDIRSEDATERIVGRGDFMATLYRHLEVDYHRTSFHDYSGRPIPIMLTDGKPIPELSRSSSRI